MQTMIGPLRISIGALWLLAIVSFAERAAAEEPTAPAGKHHVYFGTYTGAKSKGIYHAIFDRATGKLSEAELAGEAVNPSFLNISPDGKFLYAVNKEGDKQGGVLAFAIDGKSGKLTRVGEQAACGDAPCYLAVDRSGKCVLAASYSSGTVAALAIRGDGSLSDAAGLVQQTETGVDKPRSPHAHSINVDLNNRIAVAADAGIDRLFLYDLDPAAAKLTPHDPPFVATRHATGPRHFAFHPGGKLAYSNMETTSEITAFAYDGAKGTLTELQTLSTLPEPVQGNSTAEIQVHPSGKFAYVSNRGHDSIAMFSIDPETGRMTALGHQPSGGKVPRNFGIDLCGGYLLAANQATDNVVVFRIDAQTGKLTPTGQSIEVGAPVCVKFVPVAE
jgi:6-phosphogluconolactonase